MQSLIEDVSEKAAWKAWEKGATGQIVDSINRCREAQGLTIKQLSVRLAAYGWPVDLATLNGILGSKKRASLSVGEIYAFARALSVTPLYLLLGMPVHVEVEPGRIFGGSSVTNVELMQWMMGDNPLPGSDALVQDDARQERDYEMYMQARAAVRGLFAYSSALQALEWENALLMEAERIDPSGTTLQSTRAQHVRESLMSEIEHLIELRFELLDDELAPLPALPLALEFLDDDDLDLNSVVLPILGLADVERNRKARRYIRRRMTESERVRVIPADSGRPAAVGYVPTA